MPDKKKSNKNVFVWFLIIFLGLITIFTSLSSSSITSYNYFNIFELNKSLENVSYQDKNNNFTGDNIFSGSNIFENITAIDYTNINNVNNSEYHQGLTPQEVADLYVDDDSAYWKSDGTSTATGNWDITPYDFSADVVNANTVNVGTSSLSDLGGGTLELSGGLYLLGAWLDAYNAYFDGSVEITEDLDVTGDISGNNFEGSSSGTNTGDQDLTPYWKRDGTSTATGDWDLGSNDLSFTGGDIFTDTYGYLGLGDESNLNWLLGTNDAYLGYSPTGQEFTYLYFGYPGYGSFNNIGFVLRNNGSPSWKVTDDRPSSEYNQIVLNVVGTNRDLSYFRVDVEGENAIYATREFTSIGNQRFLDTETLDFGSSGDFSFGVDGEESFYLDTKINNADGEFRVLGDLAVIDNNSLGSDKITNGDFATDASSWTLGTGWTYNSGLVEKASGTGNTGALSQASNDMVTPLEVGKIYELTFDIAFIEGKTFSNFYIDVAGWRSRIYYEEGTLKFYFVAKTTDDLQIVPNHHNTAFSIDNVTLKEVQAGDLTIGGDARVLGGLEVDGNVSGDTAFFNDYVTNSMVADIKDRKKSLDNLDNMDKWLDADKKIVYDEHYAYKKYFIEETDYSRPVTKIVKEEICDDVRDYENPKDVKCFIREREVITYPYTIQVERDGLSMETRVAEMEKMIYELNEYNQELQSENSLIKSELCKKDVSYEWCKVIK